MASEKQASNYHSGIKFTVILFILIGLYLTTFVNYLLFHALAEIFSIAVAYCLFMISWHSRNYIKNPYLLFIGIAYFFIGSIDLLHTLSYKGMPIFTDYDYYANQLWIAARYMESLSLMIAFFFLSKGRMSQPEKVVGVYTIITALLIASIFYWKVFPECFVAGNGLTLFKKYSEYAICLILVANMYLLQIHKDQFEKTIYRLILWSFVFTIVSELAFTVYISNYGFSNLVGHYFKIFSFFLVYQAIIKTGIERPYELIFRELTQTNAKLNEEISIRKKMQKEREALIVDLKSALTEIKTLKGILPLCSFCKKIRKDDGEWESVDVYIHEHSQADISHSVCPQCMKIHYPGME
ncbi:MAG: hypothetical protein KJ737_11905 [Proteobacteria bacterium]|nr:hypothetical protein [Pseudomonadota bacterium]